MVEVTTVAVIGAGLMGRGIAQVAAAAGYQVLLRDVSGQALESALDSMRRNLEKEVSGGKVPASHPDEVLARIRTVTDLEEALQGADLVIEAITEELALKVEVFETADRVCPPHTILASNTSALSVSEIAACTKRPEKVLGMHFFNPVHRMRLVELIRGLETNEETLVMAEEVSRRMGKETVRVRDLPGFATSRISAMVGNEAFYMLMEGVATPQEIDKAIKLGLNYPMGPFELGDLVGLDTRLRILNYLHKTLGEKFRPCPLLVQYVKAGRLGRKSGRGVYDY